MKNKLGTICMIFLLMSFFVSCGKSQTDSNNESKDKDISSTEHKVISLLANKDHWNDATQAVVDAFEKDTGIKVEVEVLPSGDAGNNIMKTRLATGAAPDILTWMSGAMMNLMAPETNFAPLNGQPFLERIDETFIAASSINGNALSVPLEPSQFNVWFYNKAAHDELNLEIPKTWDQLIANCEFIKENSGKTPVVAPYKDAWTTQLVVLQDYYNVKHYVPNLATQFSNNEIKLADIPEYVRSYEKLQELYTKELITEDSLSTTYDMGIRHLCEGDAIYFPMGSWVLDVISTNYPEYASDIGCFVQPSDDANVNGIALWLPWGLFVTTQSTNKPEAMAFLDYYVSDKGIDVYTSTVIPNGPILVKGAQLPDNILPSVADAMAYIERGTSAPGLEFECPIKPASFETITQEVAVGLKTPLEGVKKVDIENAKFAKSQNLPNW